MRPRLCAGFACSLAHMPDKYVVGAIRGAGAVSLSGYGICMQSMRHNLLHALLITRVHIPLLDVKIIELKIMNY